MIDEEYFDKEMTFEQYRRKLAEAYDRGWRHGYTHVSNVLVNDASDSLSSVGENLVERADEERDKYYSSAQKNRR